jgi:hypothetical protein
VRPAHLVGHVEVLGLAVLRLGLHAIARDRGLEVLRRPAAALREQLEERLADLPLGLGGHGGELAVVVAQRVLLLRGAAGVDRHHQQQQEDDDRDAGHGAADQQGL